MYIDDVFNLEGTHNCHHHLHIAELSVDEVWGVFYSVDLLQDFLVAG